MAKSKKTGIDMRLFNDLLDAEMKSPAEKFLTDLQLAIEEEDRRLSSSYPASTYYNPSGMSCARMMVFKKLRRPRDGGSRDAALIAITEIGTDRHERLQPYIMKMLGNDWIDVEEYIKEKGLIDVEITGRDGAETKVRHAGLNISCRCDGIIRYLGEIYILEIKTEEQSKFYKREDVAESHFNQATAYSLIFGINHVMFLYESRNIPNKKTYVLEVTEGMRQTILEMIEYCNDWAARGVIPAIPYGTTSSSCQHCDYTRECRRFGQGGGQI